MIKVNKKSIPQLLPFALPAVLIFSAFLLLPIAGTLFFSVVDWNGIAGSSIEFVGLKNFIQIFGSKNFMISMRNMLKILVTSVLFHTPIALVLAVLINSQCKGYRFFKAVFFVPTVFPITATGLMWYFVFMPTGALNVLLKNIGMENFVKMWLVEADTAMNTLAMVNVWAGIGYYMIILLAGLTTIPKELYEAAAVDGAAPVRCFFSITIPLMMPTIVMCLMLDAVNSIKLFDLVYVMTGGGPNGLTNLPTTLLYDEAFKYKHYGVGSAIGVVVMAICILMTVISKMVNRKKG